MAISILALSLTFAVCATLTCHANALRGQRRFLRRAVQTFELSHVMHERMPIWPNPNFRYKQTIVMRQEFDVLPGPERPPKIWIEANKVDTAEHAGTHIDAPCHFSRGKARLHEIPKDALFGPAVIIDVEARVNETGNADYQMSVDDLRFHERRFGRIPEYAIIFMNSGWWRRWNDTTGAYFGLRHQPGERPDSCAGCHFPSVHPEAIRWLLEYRPTFRGIGLDTGSVDSGPSVDYLAHRLLGTANKYGIENVNFAEIDGLDLRDKQLFASVAPVNFHDGSGAPARVLLFRDLDSEAEVNDEFSFRLDL